MAGFYAGRVTESSRSSALVEGIYSELKADLVGCIIRPGDDLSEGELSTRFGTSKTPVREALQRLRLEGLVDVASRRGYMATRISVSDVKEVYALRALLEPAAAAAAAERATEADVSELRALCESLADADLAPATRRQFHDRFHLAIARIGGNTRMAHVVDSLLNESQRILALFDAASLAPLPTKDNHEDLFRAIESRDAGRAADLAAGRLKVTRDAILSLLTDASSPL